MSSHDELGVKLGLSLLAWVEGNLINLDSTEAAEKQSSGNWDAGDYIVPGDRSPARSQVPSYMRTHWRGLVPNTEKD